MPPLEDPDDGDLADLLDWHEVLAESPTVIGMKTGRVMACASYVCPDTEAMHPLTRAHYLARLHEVLMLLAEDWTVDFDWWHLPAPEYPETRWRHPVDWLFDEVRRLSFHAYPRYASTATMSLTWVPPRGRRRWLRELFLTRTLDRAVRSDLDYDLMLFQQGALRFFQYLRPLGLTVEPLDADATCTYLHQTISWKHHRVRCPWPATFLDGQLKDEPFVPGQPPKLGKQWMQALTIGSWQEELGTWLPPLLAKLPFPCRFHVRWAPMGTKAADTTLNWREKEWAVAYTRMKKALQKSLGAGTAEEVVQGRDQRPEAIRAGQSVIETRAEILLGKEVLGLLTPTLLCWAPDLETLAHRVEQIEILLFHQGLIVREEEAGATLGYISSLPGHVSLGTRALPLRTQELAALMPAHDVWGGPLRNERLDGPPLFVASTDGTPFRFVTHVGETGHMLIVGPQRSGKSAFLGLTVRQWPRYPRARMALFDRDNALKCATILGGGAHYAFGMGDGDGFHVLGRIDEEAERAWALSWIEALLTEEGLPPQPHERQELWEGLGRVANLTDPRARTLSMFRSLQQIKRLKVGFEPFCKGGPFDFLDASEDAFSLDAHTVCFEMKELQDTMPRAVVPVFSLLFHRLERDWFTGDPVAIVVDEAKWLLAVPEFQDNAEVMLKTRAKKNVALWLSSQEIFDLQRTTAWQAIQASVPTRLCLPNDQALAPSVRPFYEDLGMDESEIQGIAGGQIRKDYFYHSPLGRRRFQVELSPVERLLCAASTVEELKVLDEMVTLYDRDELPMRWLEHWGYREEAATLAIGDSDEKALVRV